MSLPLPALLMTLITSPTLWLSPSATLTMLPSPSDTWKSEPAPLELAVLTVRTPTPSFSVPSAVLVPMVLMLFPLIVTPSAAVPAMPRFAAVVPFPMSWNVSDPFKPLLVSFKSR